MRAGHDRVGRGVSDSGGSAGQARQPEDEAKGDLPASFVGSSTVGFTQRCGSVLEATRCCIALNTTNSSRMELRWATHHLVGAASVWHAPCHDRGYCKVTRDSNLARNNRGPSGA